MSTTSTPGLKPSAIQILDHLRGPGSITDAQARRLYGQTRLGARIHELRQFGVAIDREYIQVRTRNGKSRIARYSLAS